MSIEKKLELVKKALELGADVDLNFHFTGDIGDAEEIAHQLQHFYKDEFIYDENHDEDFSANWIALEPPEEEQRNRVGTAIFYAID